MNCRFVLQEPLSWLLQVQTPIKQEHDDLALSGTVPEGHL